MAATFVPVPVPSVHRSWTRRRSPTLAALSVNCELSEARSAAWLRQATAQGDTSPGASRWIPGPDLWDGMSTRLEIKGADEPSCLTPTLLGYEVVQKRAQSTVYKILVTGALGGSRVIFRRYDDFCSLKEELKLLFPNFDLALPPRRWFKGSDDSAFLEERQVGLQSFLQRLLSRKEIMNSNPVKQFLCWGDQQSLFDMEETRAICETLEENNHHLQRELFENQRQVDILRKTLEEKENYINLLMKKAKHL